MAKNHKNQSDVWATKQRGLTFGANVYMYKYDCVATYSWYICHCTNSPLSLHNHKLSLHILCITAQYFLIRNTWSRGRPNFSYGFSYGAETSSEMTFNPVSVSATWFRPSFSYSRKWNLVSACRCRSTALLSGPSLQWLTICNMTAVSSFSRAVFFVALPNTDVMMETTHKALLRCGAANEMKEAASWRDAAATDWLMLSETTSS